MILDALPLPGTLLFRSVNNIPGEGEEIRKLVKHHSLMVRHPNFGLTLREIQARTAASENEVPRVIRICVPYLLEHRSPRPQLL